MRVVTLLVMLAVVLITTGCKKAEEIVDSFTHFSFDADYVMKVPAAPVSDIPVVIVTPEIATHSNELYTANKTRADLVEEVELTGLILSVQTPTGGDLDFLKSVDIYAMAEGLPDVRVAYKDIVPNDVGTMLALDVTRADLTEYFKKDKYQLKISVTTDDPIAQDYGVNAHAGFYVNAKVLGQ